jgi:hypothetical protein
MAVPTPASPMLHRVAMALPPHPMDRRGTGTAGSGDREDLGGRCWRIGSGLFRIFVRRFGRIDVREARLARSRVSSAGSVATGSGGASSRDQAGPRQVVRPDRSLGRRERTAESQERQEKRSQAMTGVLVPRGQNTRGRDPYRALLIGIRLALARGVGASPSSQRLGR